MKNMSPRERLLAMLVLIGGGAVGLFIAFDRFNNTLTTSKVRIEAMEREEADMDSIQVLYNRLSNERRDYAGKALPGSKTEAESEYISWLTHLATDTVGIERPAVGPKSGSEIKNKAGMVVYETIRVQLKATCTLPQLAHLLDEFYAANYLHSVASLSVNPTSSGGANSRNAVENRRVIVTLTADALCLADAPERTPNDELRHPNRTIEQVIADYRPLLTRDFFNPAGELPSLDTDIDSRIYVGDRIDIGLEAEDDDLMQQFTYEVDLDSLPEILKDKLALEQDFDSNSASISIPPLPEGNYEFMVRATDNGFPAEIVEERVRFTVRERVVEKPDEPEVIVEEPGPDFAEFSKVTATTRDRLGRPAVWIDVKPEAEIYKLTEGDEFEIGSFRGVVKSIEGRFVTFLVDGELFRYVTGDILSEPEVLSSVSIDDRNED